MLGCVAAFAVLGASAFMSLAHGNEEAAAAAAPQPPPPQHQQDTGVEEGAVPPSKVIKLTEATFEHDTQAATGATTGDWIVNFNSPSCGHCKRLAPTWEQLAESLYGEMNVASVECPSNRPVCERFGIRAYPTVVLFKKGKMYRFTGIDRQLSILENWARQNYSKSGAEDVPGVPTLVDKFQRVVMQHVKGFQRLYKAHPDASVVVLVFGFFIGLVTGVVMRELGVRRKAAKKATGPKTD